MRQINYYLADDNRLIRVSIVDGEIDEVAELECASTVIEEEETEEEEPEIEAYNTPPKGSMGTLPKIVGNKFEKKAPRKKGAVDYDLEAMKADIREGSMSTERIANKYGVSMGTVYMRRNDMKKKGEMADPDAEEEDEEEEKPSAPLPSHAQRIKYMVNSGDSDEKIYAAMHDLMTDAEFRAALAEARAGRKIE